MKILHIIQSLEESFGGTSIFLHNLSLNQKKQNLDLDILTTSIRGDNFINSKTALKLKNNGIKIHLFKTLQTYRFSFQLVKWINKNLRKYDCIHIHGLYRFLPEFALCYCVFNSIPVVFSPHGALEPYLLKKSNFGKIGLLYKKLIHLIFRFYLQNIPFHFTDNSERDKCLLNISCKNNFVIPIGISKKKLIKLKKNKIRDRLNFDKNDFLVGYIGRLHWKKNLVSLIKGFNIFKNQTNLSCKLLIIGADEFGHKKELEDLSKSLYLENIHFLNAIPHDQVFSYIYDLDVFALPSHSENFGITTIESLSVGTPLLISNNVPIHQYVEKYNCGIVVNTNYQSISLGLKKIYKGIIDNKIMEQNGPKLVNEKYIWENIVPEYSQMYKTISHKS